MSGICKITMRVRTGRNPRSRRACFASRLRVS